MFMLQGAILRMTGQEFDGVLARLKKHMAQLSSNNQRAEQALSQEKQRSEMAWAQLNALKQKQSRKEDQLSRFKQSLEREADQAEVRLFCDGCLRLVPEGHTCE